MDSKHAPRMGPLEWSLLLALSVLWSGSFFFTKLAVAALPPLTIVLGRVGLAAVALNLLLRATGQRMPCDRASWMAFFAMGVLNNFVPFCLIVWAQTQIASGLAAILNGATPLFTALLAHWLTDDERLTWNRLLGVVLGLGGVAVMIGLEALAGLSLHIVAEFAVLAATVSYGFAAIFGRRFKGRPPLVTATGQVTATTVMMVPVALIIDAPWTLPPPPVAIVAVAGSALLSTALAYVLFFRILATAGATNLMLVTLLIPVGALLLGHFILGEGLAAQHLLGMALIGIGLAAIDGRVFDTARRLCARDRARSRFSRG